MTAFVLGVIRSRSWSTSRFHVSLSESMKTGLQPAYTTAKAVAMLVKAGTMTSSPGSRPRLATASARAVVPLVVTIPCLTPHCSATSRSNSPM